MHEIAIRRLQNGRAAVAWLLERCRAHGARCQLRYPAGEAEVSLSQDSRQAAGSVSTRDGTRCSNSASPPPPALRSVSTSQCWPQS